MKKFIFLLLSTSILLSGCIKEDVTIDNALPIVQTISAKKLPNNQVLLTGQVNREGAAPLDILGFCYNRKHEPALIDNQIDINPRTGTFTAIVEEMYPLDTIYFNTYAGNQYGYTAGKALKYVVENNVAPTVPCTMEENSFYNGTFTTRNGFVYKSTSQVRWGKLAIIANFSNDDIHIEFNTLNPTNGVYTIGDLSTNDPTKCYASLTNSTFANGGKIYVTENGDGTYWVQFCDLVYYVGSFQVKANAKLKVTN